MTGVSTRYVVCLCRDSMDACLPIDLLGLKLVRCSPPILCQHYVTIVLHARPARMHNRWRAHVWKVGVCIAVVAHQNHHLHIGSR